MLSLIAKFKGTSKSTVVDERRQQSLVFKIMVFFFHTNTQPGAGVVGLRGGSHSELFTGLLGSGRREAVWPAVGTDT